MYSATTGTIRVTVDPVFLEEQSDPVKDRWVWAYHVRIENHGGQTLQLLDRHWLITDANGMTEEVRGDGVVGEQPMLAPGEAFEYTSGAPLQTPSGIMRGSYGMVTPGGDRVDVEIPAFSLDSPGGCLRLH